MNAPLLGIPLNAIALALQDVGGMPAGSVQRDGAGVPTGWRLFGFGRFSLTRNGQEYAGEFAPEHAAEILAQAERKGAPVPLDAHHAMADLARELGVEEERLAAALPGKALALGFGSLARRDDGLWLERVEWTDLGRRMVQGGHFRHFSPVIRGLADGRLRVTSVALTNSPALNGQESLAAEADDDDGSRERISLADLVTTRAATPGRKEQKVDTILKLLGAVLGMDTIALADDGKIPADVETKLSQLRDELPGLRAAGALGAKVRDALTLSAEAGEPEVLGALQGLKAKGEAHDQLKARVDALELEAEKERRQKVIDRGLAEGKLTKALVDGWCKDQDAAALEAYLKVAPVVVKPGITIGTGDLAPEDEVALTAEDRKVCILTGISETDFLATKKTMRG